MAKVNIVIPDDVLRELRHAVIERYGGEKGSLSKAVTEAIRLWLKQAAAPAKKK
jgi:Arc/MetJ-type ribon-helix-helix transcriptional regulator